MCRGKLPRRRILDYLDKEYVQATDSDENNDETETDESNAPRNPITEKITSFGAISTAVLILFLFFSELLLFCFYVLPGLRENQDQIIAHRLCKNFPSWQFIENMTDSWCSPRVFNREFRVEVQCQCFVPDMVQNMT